MQSTSIVNKAQQYCKQHGHRFTDPRQRVLQVLASKQQGLGAYEILAELTTKDYQPAPPTIYRAIEFWEKHGFVHKIPSLKKYRVCTHSHPNSHTIYMICKSCDSVEEIHSKQELLPSTVKNRFQVSSLSTEVFGECDEC
jgi:Fur family zinc uptake transcriptional regulator